MAFFLACIMAAALVIYVLLAGADYGAGLWDLLSSGPNKEQQQTLISNAIQPIWEANHVWLILIVVLLFTGFPLAFSEVMTALCLPLLLMVAGIVLRGSSFVFRAYTPANPRMQRLCGYIFSVSSCFTPFLGGTILGAVSGNSIQVSGDASVNGYLLNWLTPFAVSAGVLTLSLCAFLSAAYLVVESPTSPIRLYFRQRAGMSAFISIVALCVTVIFGKHEAPELIANQLHHPLAIGFEVAFVVFLLIAGITLYKDSASLARISTAACVSCAALSWVAAQYPYLVHPQRTIFNSVLSEGVVRDVVIACALGTIVLFPSLGLLFYIFKDERRERATGTATTVQS